MDVKKAAEKAVKAAGTAAAAGAIIGFKVDGQPLRDKQSPSKVTAFGIPWYQQDSDGKRWFLFFRLRDRSQLNRR